MWLCEESNKAHINLRLTDAIFDPQLIHVSGSLRSGLVALPDPETMGIAVGISILSCIQAETYVMSDLLPVKDFIFKSWQYHMSGSLRSGLVVLPDLANMDTAVWISMLPCKQTEIHVMSDQLPVDGRHLWFCHKSTRRAVSTLVWLCRPTSKTRLYPLEFRCYRVWQPRFTLCHIYFRLMANIFDSFPDCLTWSGTDSCIIAMLDPWNMGSVFGILIVSHLEAEIWVKLWLHGCHLEFATSGCKEKYSHYSHWTACTRK